MKKNLLSQFMIDLTSQVLSRSITKGLELAKNKKNQNQNQPRKFKFLHDNSSKELKQHIKDSNQNNNDFNQKRKNELSFKLGVDSIGQDIIYSFKKYGHLNTVSNLYLTDNEYNQHIMMNNLFKLNINQLFNRSITHKVYLVENIELYRDYKLNNGDDRTQKSKYDIDNNKFNINHITNLKYIDFVIKDIKEIIKYRKTLCQYYNVKNIDELIDRYNKDCKDLILIIEDYDEEFFRLLEKNHLSVESFLRDAYDMNIFVVFNHYLTNPIDELDDQIQSSIYFKDNDNSMCEELKSQGEFRFIIDDQEINKKGLIDKY